MVPNGLRISCGASGFGSHISMWLGPPESQNRITDFLPCELPPALAWLCFASSVGKDSPAIPVSPVCKNHRRDRWQIKSFAGMNGEANDETACWAA